jgi:hypothetical protein
MTINFNKPKNNNKDTHSLGVGHVDEHAFHLGGELVAALGLELGHHRLLRLVRHGLAYNQLNSIKYTT